MRGLGVEVKNRGREAGIRRRLATCETAGWAACATSKIRRCAPAGCPVIRSLQQKAPAKALHQTRSHSPFSQATRQASENPLRVHVPLWPTLPDDHRANCRAAAARYRASPAPASCWINASGDFSKASYNHIASSLARASDCFGNHASTAPSTSADGR